MTSIDDLERRLLLIDQTHDEGSRLKGIAFEKTQNVSLGLGKDLRDFPVFIPFGSWEKAKNAPETKPEQLDASFPSPLQAAFKDVLDKGKDSKMCFIDFTSLDPHKEFFMQGGANSVANALIEAINDIKDESITPVIRVVAGSDNTGDLLQDSRDKWRSIFKEGAQEIKNKKATLCVGMYRPELEASSDQAAKDWLDGLAQDVNTTLKQLQDLLQGLPGTKALDEVFKNLPTQKLIDAVKAKQQRQYSWNHAKVLAVNGKVMMTGGGNYWTFDSSGENGNHGNEILDQQAKARGDLAISVHKFCDQFWKYLNKIPQSDKYSFQQSVLLSSDMSDDKWQQGLVPPAPSFPSVPGDAKFKALSVARIGDWHGKNFEYPVQIMDALRDMLLNAVFEATQTQGEEMQGMLTILCYALMTDDGEALRHLTEAIHNYKGGITGAITDWFKSLLRSGPDVNTKGSFSPFKGLKANPNAWASRFARVCTIANAKQNVIVCQQKLAMDDIQGELNAMTEDKSGKKLTVLQQINEWLNLDEQHAWNGLVWPYDLLIAFGYALARTRGTKTGAAEIDVVLSTHTMFGNNDGWADKAPVAELTHRLKIIMKGMAKLNSYTGLVPGFFSNVTSSADVFTHVDPVPLNLIDKVVSEKFKVRRVLGGTNLYSNHCKIVCVDDRMLYIGSDNAYPSYNQEHGMWVENADAVNAWKDVFWTENWKRATEEK